MSDEEDSGAASAEVRAPRLPRRPSGANGALPPKEDLPQLLVEPICPLIPDLGQPESLLQRPTFLEVLRGADTGDAWGGRLHWGYVTISAGPEDVIEHVDHGQGGLYFLVPCDARRKPVKGRVGEINLPPNPVRWARFLKAQDEEVHRIKGSPGVPSESSDIATLRGMVHDLQVKLSQAGSSAAPATDPALAAILASLAQTQQALTAALTGQGSARSPLDDLDKLTSIVRNLQPPQPLIAPQAASPSDPASLLNAVMGAAKTMLDMSGSTGSKTDSKAAEIAKKTEQIKAVTGALNDLFPKIVGGIAAIRDAGNRTPSEAPASTTTATSSDASTPSPNPPPAAQAAKGDQSKMEAAKQALNDLDARLRNPAVSPQQIGAEFLEKIASGALPRWYKSLLSVVDAKNLDSQLDALERPDWKTEPLRSRFLGAIEHVKTAA